MQNCSPTRTPTLRLVALWLLPLLAANGAGCGAEGLEDEDLGQSKAGLVVPMEFDVSIRPYRIEAVVTEDQGSIFHEAGDELLTIYSIELIRNNQIVAVRVASDYRFMRPGSVANLGDPGVAFAELSLRARSTDQVRVRVSLIDIDDDSDMRETLTNIQRSAQALSTASSLAFPPATPVLSILNTGLQIAGLIWAFFDWLDEDDPLGEAVIDLGALRANAWSVTRQISQYSGGSWDWLYRVGINVSVKEARLPYHASLRPSSNLNTCIDVPNGTTQRVGLQGFGCHGGLNQLWFLEPVSASVYRIRSSGTQLCIDVPGSLAQDGLQVQQSTCHDGRNQQWAITSHGQYTTVRNLATNMYLQVATDGRLVQKSYSAVTSNAAIFDVRIEHLDTADYAPRYNGQCIDIPNGTTSDSALQAYPCHGGTNQSWRFEPLGGGLFQVRSVRSSKCVTVAGTTSVTQAACDGRSTQRLALRFVPEDMYPRGSLELYSAAVNACVSRPTSGSGWLATGTCRSYLVNGETRWEPGKR